MFIPKKYLITLEMTKNSNLVRKIYDQRVTLRSPKHCLLSIYLLEQRELGEESVYWRYIGMLPEKYETFPINYTDEEMKELEGSPFEEQLEQKITDIEKDYSTIISVDG
mgnify:CR=1 FL=1